MVATLSPKLPVDTLARRSATGQRLLGSRRVPSRPSVMQLTLEHGQHVDAMRRLHLLDREDPAVTGLPDVGASTAHLQIWSCSIRFKKNSPNNDVIAFTPASGAGTRGRDGRDHSPARSRRARETTLSTGCHRKREAAGAERPPRNWHDLPVPAPNRSGHHAAAELPDLLPAGAPPGNQHC